ncbi:MAG: plasmid stabilization protein [Pseudomonadota bacterium]|nr:plasmid stabilization protein [Pseudomonadota bacterium]
MGSVFIRNVDDQLKARLRVQAAEHGRSMEEEARVILREALETPAPTYTLAQSIREKFAPLGGVELQIPPRELMRDPPDFSE